MLSALITYLTLIPFALHVVLGCCWHHTHGMQGGCSSCTAATSAPAAEHTCAHAHHGHKCGSPHAESTCNTEHHSPAESPARHHDCHEGHCVFDVVKAYEFTNLSLVAYDGPANQVLAIANLSVRSAPASSLESPGYSPNTLLRCALLQSWLI